MLKDAIEKIIGLPWSNQVLVYDPDQLLSRTGVEDSAVAMGYDLLHFVDSEVLRLTYERTYRLNRDKKVLLVVHDNKAYVPYDIQKSFVAAKLSYETVFPGLPAGFLRNRLREDLELLYIASCNRRGNQVKEAAADEFFRQGIYSQENVQAYAAILLAECDSLLNRPHSHRTWGSLAASLAKLSSFRNMGFWISRYDELLPCVQVGFAQWMELGYKMLSGTSDNEQPAMLHRVPDFLARKGGKVALIIMDGMNFENWFAYYHNASKLAHNVTVKATYSFVPTVTSIARQSAFSGALPVLHEQPFSLANEEKQWRKFWLNAGYRDDEVFFAKNLAPDIPERARIVGLVVNVVDDLMHAQLQGQDGMSRDIAAWAKQDELGMLINRLKQTGYAVFITADHGNASAIGVGRLKNEGLLTEMTSRRARVYSVFAASETMKRPEVKAYAGYYLPKGYQYFICEEGACFGDSGKEYITHGGMSLHEVVVPFIEVEDN